MDRALERGLNQQSVLAGTAEQALDSLKLAMRHDHLVQQGASEAQMQEQREALGALTRKILQLRHTQESLTMTAVGHAGHMMQQHIEAALRGAQAHVDALVQGASEAQRAELHEATAVIKQLGEQQHRYHPRGRRPTTTR